VTSAWLTAGLFHEMVDGRLDGLRPLSQLLAGATWSRPSTRAGCSRPIPG